MSREISQTVLDSLEDSVIYPFFAVELFFDAASLRLWTGEGTLIYEELEWLGASTLMSIDVIEETSEIAAKGATLTLSGIPPEVLGLALGQAYQGRKAKIYFGMFNGDQTDLTEVFSGYMDQMNIEEGAESSRITLMIENKLIDLEKPRTSRFTNAYQKFLYPNDKGLEFVEELQDKDLYWGRAAPT